MKFPHLRSVALLAIALLIPSLAQAQKRQRDRITREEILDSPQKDADLYQVIRSIRPHFLEPPKGVRSGGYSTINPIVVYVDGKKDTGLDALKLMTARDIEDVRYFEPSKSMAEFGPIANGGAVIVKRYKAPKQ